MLRVEPHFFTAGLASLRLDRLLLICLLRFKEHVMVNHCVLGHLFGWSFYLFWVLLGHGLRLLFGCDRCLGLYLSFRLCERLDQVVGPLGLGGLHKASLELGPFLKHTSQLNVKYLRLDAYLRCVLTDKFQERLTSI